MFLFRLTNGLPGWRRPNPKRKTMTKNKKTKQKIENLQKYQKKIYKMFHNSRHPSERSPVVSLLDIARIFFLRISTPPYVVCCNLDILHVGLFVCDPTANLIMLL